MVKIKQLNTIFYFYSKCLSKMQNKITELFNIKFPVVQAGMVWCSGWELASAVSNAGGLGLIGAGSMDAELLKIHIRKTKKSTARSFGVNIPLLKQHVDQLIDVVIQEGVKIVFTSAGNPKTWTQTLKKEGITVVHVVANTTFAQKARQAGVDAVVAEGFEAGGHNGREETTTLTLVPLVKQAVDLPLIAAGGIHSGQSMMAAMILGADGVQIGSKFVMSEESSAHLNFKNEIIKSAEGDTQLCMKKLVPVRMMKNDFYKKISLAEDQGASSADLLKILATGRSRLGMFEGNLSEGELEIGQASALFEEIMPAQEIMQQIINEFKEAKKQVNSNNKFDF